MSDVRQKSGARALRRMAGRATTVVLTSVVLVAFGATAASARPRPVNPPAPTGTITSNSNGTVTINVSGQWNWPLTGAGHIKSASAAKPCGAHYGVGWGMVWNDADDPGYKITYFHGGPHSQFVGSSLAVNGNTVDASVHYNTGSPCGTFDASTGVTSQWSDSHTYADGNSLPTSICVVSYVLRKAPSANKSRQYLVNKNNANAFKTAVKQGNAAAWTTSPACFDPSTLKASPVIVTTATNAQVGSPIGDTSTLSGTSQDVTASVNQVRTISVVGNAGGTVIFNLYGPTDTNCTSTPIFTSPPITVNGDGTYGPVSFTPTQGAGTYRWIATYSGDQNNNGATELCGAAGETSVVSTAPVTSPANPPTSPGSSVPVVVTKASTGTAALVPVVGATTVHTGEPWAGSKPFEVALIGFGLSLMGLGFFQRRRLALRKRAQPQS
ncbi:MAG TPA: hypothetical protein VNC61_04015 [Acidimicrobiales bacterium]|nr:hypothetical protein [Acidimicrobiales bacterium]